MIILLFAVPACSSHRAVTTSGSATQQEGVTVTKEAPSSKETIGEIRERELQNPTPPRGDRAIPFHRIPREGETLTPQGPAADNGAK